MEQGASKRADFRLPAAAPFAAAAKCVVCDAELSIHERAVGEICSRAECRWRHASKKANEGLRRRDALRRRALLAEKTLPRLPGNDDVGERVLVVIPSNDRRLVHLKKRFVGEFVDRLMTIISQAAVIRYGAVKDQPSGITTGVTTDDGPPRREIRAGDMQVLANSCALCRGYCCRLGKGHAFIKVETIVRYMQKHPAERPRDVLDAYVSRIRHRAFEDSCVYHGPDGCALPREMRDQTCNRYLCDGLHDLLDQREESDSERSVAVAVGDYDHEIDFEEPGATYARPAVVSGDELQMGDELNPDQITPDEGHDENSI